MSFLFIHIPKCGGTSISQVLIPDNVGLCQGKNGLQWLGSGYPQPTIDMIITGYVGGTKVTPPDDLSDYPYVFSIVRNPWDRAVSWYHWHVNDTDSKNTKKSHFNWYKQFDSFKDWIMDGMRTPIHSTKTYFSMREWIQYGQEPDLVCKRINERRRYLGGGLSEIIPDDIYKMEDLFDPEKEDWLTLMHKCGLDSKTKRKHLNKSKRKPKFKDYYSLETAQTVYDICKDDIEFFDYKFF